jgi:hypothetical protein
VGIGKSSEEGDPQNWPKIMNTKTKFCEEDSDRDDATNITKDDYFANSNI